MNKLWHQQPKSVAFPFHFDSNVVFQMILINILFLVSFANHFYLLPVFFISNETFVEGSYAL